MSSRLKHVAHYAYFVAPNASGTLKTEIPREAGNGPRRPPFFVSQMGKFATVLYEHDSMRNPGEPNDP